MLQTKTISFSSFRCKPSCEYFALVWFDNARDVSNDWSHTLHVNVVLLSKSIFDVVLLMKRLRLVEWTYSTSIYTFLIVYRARNVSARSQTPFELHLFHLVLEVFDVALRHSHRVKQTGATQIELSESFHAALAVFTPHVHPGLSKQHREWLE